MLYQSYGLLAVKPYDSIINYVYTELL